MHPLAILFGVLFTVAVSTALGALLLRDSCDDLGIRFVAGAAVLSVLVFSLCCVGLAYPLVFAAVGAAALLPCLRHAWPGPLPRMLPGWEKYLFLAIFAIYFILYFFNSMAPELSPDGSAYHLGLVSRYLREHGFHRITESIYASFSEGVEMLFLFAFAFGEHSAAAMVHFVFLLALAWQMFSYGRRAGWALAGASGAVLVFASPVVGKDGISAYNDVAVAAIAFTLFHLLQIWDEKRSSRLLVAIGLVAGFAYAAKYIAGFAVPYALGFVAWKSRRTRDVLTVALCAAVLIAPWMAKNWLWLHNPLSPFFNNVFPNPYVMVSFEDQHRRLLAMYDVESRWQIPMQVTTYGSHSGLLGPVFLLSPLALLALRRREGRQLLLAALVFGGNYFSYVSSRMLIPPLPFVALAMTLVLSRIPGLAVAAVLVHAVISWPSLVPKYAHRDAWGLASRIPFRQALRIKPEAGFLESNLAQYGATRMVERTATPGSTVFSFRAIPEAYTSRRVLVEYESAGNHIAGMILWTPVVPEYAPTWRLRFLFARQPLRAIRVVQTNTGTDSWSIHELRVFDGARELPRDPRWRLRAHPYPWGIQEAFDNSLITFWLCGDTLHPGQFVQVDFGESEPADSVLIETAPNQNGIRLKLEGQDASGQWALLAPAPRLSDAARPLGLRRAAAEELRRRGIDYVLVFDDEFGADDLRHNADLWGVRQVGEYRGARLYQLP